MHENLIRPNVVGPALARALGDARWDDLAAVLIAGGKSNLTFELTSAAGTVVLRRPPSGPLLPRAHDMGGRPGSSARWRRHPCRCRRSCWRRAPAS